jgi:hypothetical protein
VVDLVALDKPDRVPAIVYIGCPALILGPRRPCQSALAQSVLSGDC